MLLGQLLTPQKISETANKLAEQLTKFELEPGEMKPLMVINPHQNGKVMINVITLKEENGIVKYSRQLESKELSAEFLLEMLKGAEF